MEAGRRPPSSFWTWQVPIRHKKSTKDDPITNVVPTRDQQRWAEKGSKLTRSNRRPPWRPTECSERHKPQDHDEGDPGCVLRQKRQPKPDGSPCQSARFEFLFTDNPSSLHDGPRNPEGQPPLIRNGGREDEVHRKECGKHNGESLQGRPFGMYPVREPGRPKH